MHRSESSPPSSDEGGGLRRHQGRGPILEALLQKKLIKKGKKTASGAYQFLVTKAGEKHVPAGTRRSECPGTGSRTQCGSGGLAVAVARRSRPDGRDRSPRSSDLVSEVPTLPFLTHADERRLGPDEPASLVC